jgi:hypothetical protein
VAYGEWVALEGGQSGEGGSDSDRCDWARRSPGLRPIGWPVASRSIVWIMDSPSVVAAPKSPLSVGPQGD